MYPACLMRWLMTAGPDGITRTGFHASRRAAWGAMTARSVPVQVLIIVPSFAAGLLRGRGGSRSGACGGGGGRLRPEVGFVRAQHGPGDARGFGGLRHHGDLDRAAYQDAADPRRRPPRLRLERGGASPRWRPASAAAARSGVALPADAAGASAVGALIVHAASAPPRRRSPGPERNCPPSPIAATMACAVSGRCPERPDGGKPAHARVGLGTAPTICASRRRRRSGGPATGPAGLHNAGRSTRLDRRVGRGLDLLAQPGEAAAALRRDDAELGEQGPRVAVHQLRALFAPADHAPSPGRAPPAARRSSPSPGACPAAADGLADRLGVARIGLVAPDERLHIPRRDQPHLVACTRSCPPQWCELPHAPMPITAGGSVAKKLLQRRPTGAACARRPACRHPRREPGSRSSPISRPIMVACMADGSSCCPSSITGQSGTNDAVEGPSTQHREELSCLPSGGTQGRSDPDATWIATGAGAPSR